MTVSKPPTRRAVLAGALSTCFVPRTGWCIGDGSKIKIAQIRYSGNWNPRKMATLVLAQEVRYRTSIDVQLKPITLKLTDKNLFYQPFAVLAGVGRFRLSNKERAQLKKWIEGGGFMLIDNAGRTAPSVPFDQSVRATIERLFPGRKLAKIPPQHVLYRTFYVLDFPAGRAIHRPFMEGLFIDGRLAILYTQNDLLGALDRDQLGAWTYDVTPGGEVQREKAKRLAVNVVQYALCLDYKDDQVHLDYLLHQRRWRINPPRLKAP
jgi:hypothetical protein